MPRYTADRTENVETLFDTNVWQRTWSLLPLHLNIDKLKRHWWFKIWRFNLHRRC